MLKFLNLQPEIFGMDINDLSLRIVKLRKKRSGFNLVSFNEVQIKPGVVKEGVIEDEKSLVKTIKLAIDTVKGEGLNTKYVIASLPEEKSFFQVIRMPNMTELELKSAVPFEAENHIPLSIDKVYLDFQIVESHKNKKNTDHLDLLINEMPKSVVDSYVSCFKKANLKPCILEVESQAIVRALLKNEEVMSPVILIDFGQTKTSFIIFSGNSIRFTSSITFSSQQLTQAIADSLSISVNDAEKLKIEYGLMNDSKKKYDIAKIINPILDNLIAQIKKYIHFYYGHVSQEYFSLDNKIGKIILCGGGAYLKDLPSFISKELDIPVELGNPLRSIMSKKSGNMISDNNILSFTTALGLAIRGANGT